MSMTMAEKVVALKSWMEENPLRKKREEVKASKDHAAVLMGISVSTIKTWESGAHMPSQPSMKRIARFLELPVSGSRALWDAWWNSRPGQSELTDERLVTKKGGRPY
jgi:transcriptional regulator with XRE-family HTH domain